ncbi:MAG: type II toxin-antitoxin system VapC family toxin [Deltaproteobacteria bacterium]|nr:type II toxin-antitoxin system VapC family toxin [Deltaproteobacteria bacterium]
MNVVDSCGWLEYFADGRNADFFAPAIEDEPQLIVPSICLLEVCKRLLLARTEHEAITAMAAMERGRVIALDDRIALLAARLGIEHGLPLADSVVLATARAYDAEVWTQDADFEGLAGVRYIKAR